MAPGYHALVRIDTLKCLTSLGAVLLLTTACERATPTPTAGTPAASAPAAEMVTMAQVREDVPLPLTRLLGRPVAEVQALLGEPQGKGMVRSTCFRLAPGRTHFKCSFAMQSYADKTGNFRMVRVEYEDGIAWAVAYDGWKHGSGAFTAEALLGSAGLTLPEPGNLKEPAAGVRLWSWNNARARLLIAGKQHRVEVSIIGEDWDRSRLEVANNHPLTPEQQALIVPISAKGPTQTLMPAEPAVPAEPATP